MCSSLDGSHNRAVTSTAAIFAQATRSWPAGSSRLHRSSSPSPRHKASAKYTSPNRRERSMQTPLSRTGAVKCRLPSSNNTASSGAPISRRASTRASVRPSGKILSRWNHLCFAGGGLIRWGVADVDERESRTL
jgi:hypothetical protein